MKLKTKLGDKRKQKIFRVAKEKCYKKLKEL